MSLNAPSGAVRRMACTASLRVAAGLDIGLSAIQLRETIKSDYSAAVVTMPLASADLVIPARGPFGTVGVGRVALAHRPTGQTGRYPVTCSGFG